MYRRFADTRFTDRAAFLRVTRLETRTGSGKKKKKRKKGRPPCQGLRGATDGKNGVRAAIAIRSLLDPLSLSLSSPAYIT